MITRTVFPPTRMQSAQNRQPQCDDYVMAQVIENVPTNNTDCTIDKELVAKDDHELAIWDL